MPYNFVPDSFHTGVTAEVLRAKIERKSTISLQRGQICWKCSNFEHCRIRIQTSSHLYTGVSSDT